ncbi:hypothetical protein FXO38_18616 [Capsicum annuum]|nr:hypothetical protein FXO38_18616 [Capsicum annuum]
MNTLPCQNESCSGPNGDRFAVSMNNTSFVLARIDILGAYYKNIKGLYRDEFPSFLQFNFNFMGDSLPMELQRLGNFDKDKDLFQYNLIDPPLQSTIAIVRNGWATIRFKVDNPVFLLWNRSMVYTLSFSEADPGSELSGCQVGEHWTHIAHGLRNVLLYSRVGVYHKGQNEEDCVWLVVHAQRVEDTKKKSIKVEKFQSKRAKPANQKVICSEITPTAKGAYEAKKSPTTTSQLQLQRALPLGQFVVIVDEFLEVFLDEFPGIPLYREIDFEIDLLPDTHPISILQHRVAPTELKVLKEQLKDLIDNAFICPSILVLVVTIDVLSILFSRREEILQKREAQSLHVGPYRILSHFENIAYELELPAALASAHPVFHISLLNKCIGDLSFIVLLESVGVEDNLAYEEVPVEILNRQIRRLRNKELP